MSRHARLATLALAVFTMFAMAPDVVQAQRRAIPRHPPHPQRVVIARGHVFIGGYFYDPFFGPYPWWHRRDYPYWYYPVFDNRADVRLRVEPKAAERASVYVDGFYAGIVDDFNGVFQSVPLTPGGHSIVLYLEGYRTVRHNIYLQPGAAFNLRQTMEKLPPGVASEPPDVASPVPAPPAGSYRTPVTPPSRSAPQAPAPAASKAVGFGTLDIWVQPSSAEVVIDGQPWATSDEGHFVVQVPAGKHRIEVTKPGYRGYSSEIDVPEGEAMPLNVSLMTSTSR